MKACARVDVFLQNVGYSLLYETGARPLIDGDWTMQINETWEESPEWEEMIIK